MKHIVRWLCVLAALMCLAVACERKPKVDPLPAWATHNPCSGNADELKCREALLLDEATAYRNGCEIHSNYIERARCRSKIDSDYKERLAKLREEYGL